ncbi:nicotinamide N-methyltransferase-like [Ascaphus truei]|uniref:nicotinamide N-methyltransferase-like n=1 Tax=Ascaphus truei TaxID=8439 RepID=UPI003F597765
MDSSLHKHYHDEEFDPRGFIDTYFYPENNDMFEEVLVYPITQLFKTFSSEINVIEFTDVNIREFEMWRNKEPGAADWSHAAKIVCELEGKSEEWQGKEDKARRAVKRVVKCDFTKDNPLEPVVLPQMDCLLCMFVLQVVSKDHQAFCSNLKKLASMLKTGGDILLFGTFNKSYYMVGEHKFFYLSHDEDLIREAVCEAGFIIESLESMRTKKTSILADYEHVIFLIGRKEREGSESEREEDTAEGPEQWPVRIGDFDRLYRDLKTLLQAEIQELREDVKTRGERTGAMEVKMAAATKSIKKADKKSTYLQT